MTAIEKPAYLNYDDCLDDDGQIIREVYNEWMAEVAEIRDQIDNIMAHHPLVVKDEKNAAQVVTTDYIQVWRYYPRALNMAMRGSDNYYYMVKLNLSSNMPSDEFVLFYGQSKKGEDIERPHTFRNGDWRLVLDELSAQALQEFEETGNTNDIDVKVDEYAPYDIFIPEQLEEGMPDIIKSRFKQTGDPRELSMLLEKGWKLGELKHVEQPSPYDPFFSAILYLPKD